MKLKGLFLFIKSLRRLPVWAVALLAVEVLLVIVSAVLIPIILAK